MKTYKKQTEEHTIWSEQLNGVTVKFYIKKRENGSWFHGFKLPGKTGCDTKAKSKPTELEVRNYFLKVSNI